MRAALPDSDEEVAPPPPTDRKYRPSVACHDDVREARPSTTWTVEWVLEASKRMASQDVAPGPDGIPGRVWAESTNILAPRLRRLFTRCLREGVYPRAWRTAKFVLLRKEGRPLDSPASYRPVCLLDEVNKLLERIIATRLEAHISQRVPGWHDRQYGFRRGRPTVDAVNRVMCEHLRGGSTGGAPDEIPGSHDRRSSRTLSSRPLN